MIRLLFFVEILFFICVSVNAEDRKYYQFFHDESQRQEKTWHYSPYEGAISGTIAFAFGNLAYFSVKDPVLKLAYSGVQTIGIVNVAQGVYDLKRPTLEKEFANLLDPKIKIYSREKISKGIVKIFADEERAKRLSIFYGSTLLVAQYSLNAFVGSPTKSLKNTYLFLASINGIVSIYSLTQKGKYEKFYYGNDLDISLLSEFQGRVLPSFNISWSF